jgi:hypothetical protein
MAVSDSPKSFSLDTAAVLLALVIALLVRLGVITTVFW